MMSFPKKIDLFLSSYQRRKLFCSGWLLLLCTLNHSHRRAAYVQPFIGWVIITATPSVSVVFLLYFRDFLVFVFNKVKTFYCLCDWLVAWLFYLVGFLLLKTFSFIDTYYSYNTNHVHYVKYSTCGLLVWSKSFVHKKIIE